VICVDPRTGGYLMIASSAMVAFSLSSLCSYEFQHFKRKEYYLKDENEAPSAIELARAPGFRQGYSSLDQNRNLPTKVIGGNMKEDYCFCSSLSCPKKSHILLMNLTKDVFFLNMAHLQLTLDYLKDVLFKQYTKQKRKLSINGSNNAENLPTGAVITSQSVRMAIKDEPVKSEPETTHRMKYLVLNCEKTQYFDLSACKDLNDICKEFENAGVTVLYTELRPDLRGKLSKCGCEEKRLRFSDMDILEVLDLICSGGLEGEQ